MPFADGPLAPPARPASAAASSDWGEQMFQTLGQRVAKSGGS